MGILSIFSTEYIPYEKTVVEKRAPTDESIRLWEEMKEKAFKSILDTVIVDNNIFKGKAILYQDLLSYKKVLRYSFFLNGREFSGEEDMRVDLKKEEIVEFLYHELSDRIAQEIFTMVLNG